MTATRAGRLVARVLGRPAVPSETTIEVEHEGVSHRIRLKRVAAARRYTLRVRMARGDILLTMPLRGTLDAATAFARSHAAWVAGRVGQLQRPIAFEPGAVIPFCGLPHHLQLRTGLRRRVWVEASANEGEPPLICVSGAPHDFAGEVDRYLRGEARRLLTEAAERHAASVGRRVMGLTLRDTKSRWGSCSARGRLNFSWRLVLAPPGVLDYLAAHEVAHLVHMNHSARFWALARELAPQMDEAEAWLKQHGATLHRYGAAPLMPESRSGRS